MKRRILSFIAGILIAGCSSFTAIRDIDQNPREYDGKEVVVEGTVKEAFSLVLVKYFVLSDGSGNELPVVTQRGLPVQGESVKVKGKITSGFSLGTKTMTVLVEENG